LGELLFIGLGLQDELGMSLRGQEEARDCDILLSEFYTSPMPGLSRERLEKVVGKSVQVLTRRDVEENAETMILVRARTMRIGFLVPGDPMVATTHIDLRLRAIKAGIKTRIIHASSVASAAAGVSGLQSYKFGKTVSVPASWIGEFPESIYTAIRNNRKLGLHTLVLLEVNVENMTYISIPAALKQLLTLSKHQPDNVITPETLAIGISRLEAPDAMIKAGTISEIMQTDFGGPPYTIIFPGELHFVEAEALHLLCGAPKELPGASGHRSELSEDPTERASKYITTFSKAEKELVPVKEDTLVKSRNIRRVSDAMERYLKDAEHYLTHSKPSTSLAAIAYAEGLLDALKFLELTEAKPLQ
jgi:diphthine synthase